MLLKADRIEGVDKEELEKLDNDIKDIEIKIDKLGKDILLYKTECNKSELLPSR